MKDNVIQQKSLEFAMKVVKASQFLKSKHEFILSSQFLRSGTSIGANIEEAIGAHSKKDFLSKLTISYKETRETMYWLKLLRHGSYITPKDYNLLYNDCEEICKIITKIQKTLKQSLRED